jgi:alpha-beta hydrolase superfamily lysophospholipase
MTLPTAWVAAMVEYQKRFLQADSHSAALQIIQGTDDKTVDWKKNLPLIARKFPASQTHFIEGARHHMVNESSAYREKIFAKLGEIIGRSNTAATTD